MSANNKILTFTVGVVVGVALSWSCERFYALLAEMIRAEVKNTVGHDSVLRPNFKPGGAG